MTVPLSRVARTPVVEVRKGRYQLVALTLDQETFPLTWTLGAPALLEPTAAALERFLEQERARYREEGSAEPRADGAERLPLAADPAAAVPSARC